MKNKFLTSLVLMATIAFGVSVANCNSTDFNSLSALTEQTKVITFADYPEGVQYAKNEEHDLGDGFKMTTNEASFTSELRLYAAYSDDKVARGASTALLQAPTNIKMTKLTFTAKKKFGTIDIFDENNNKTALTLSSQNNDLEVALAAASNKVNICATTVQVRISKLVVTYLTESISGLTEAGKTWGQNFLTTLGNECGLNGTAEYNLSKATWDALGTSYKALVDTDKAIFKSATADAKGSVENKVASLYDYCRSKYEFARDAGNFIGRTNVIKAVDSPLDTSDNSTFLLVSLSIAALAVIGVSIIFARRSYLKNK